MNITRNKLIIAFFTLLVGVEIPILMNIHMWFINFLIFIYIITIPGILIIFLLKIKKIELWMYIILTVGLSLSFLVLSGLLINYTMYNLLHRAILTSNVFFYEYISLIIILSIPTYLRNRTFLGTFTRIKFPNFFTSLVWIFPSLSIFLSVIGANVLNNGGTNTITMTTIAGMALYMIFLLFFYKKVKPSVFPYTIFCFSLSLLCMLSLRSWFVSGWDIQGEYKVFQLTKHLGYWSSTTVKDDYNSCLSITILPTVLSTLTHINDTYIFKFLYQILFSIVPVAVYFIARRYLNNILSFFSGIYFISQPFFVQPMIALMRQEIAFVFFSLMVLVIFTDKLTDNVKKLLFLIFGMSMIVSHYSMTYIALILLLVTYCIMLFFRITEYVPYTSSFYRTLKLSIARKNIPHKYVIYPEVLIVLLLFSLFWYSYINRNADHAIQVSQSVVKNIKNIFSSDGNNQESQKATALFSNGSTNTIESINRYINQETALYVKDGNPRYSYKDYQNLSISPKFSESVRPVTPNILNKYINIGFLILKQLTKLFVLVGLLLFLFTKFRSSKYQREFILFGLISELLIIFMIADPLLAAEYNLSRLYLQLLTILVVPAIVGGLFILLPLKRIRVYILGLTLISIFLYFSGFTNQFFGGDAFMQLNNYGSDYDKFYVHKQEIAAAQWITTNRKKDYVLFADRTSQLRLTYVSNQYSNNIILPQIIFKTGYVYASVTNLSKQIVISYFNGDDLLYTFPTNFFDDNKNLIYNNGGARIYK